MRTPRPRKPTQIQSTYVESWACLKCEARFITFCTGTDLFVAHRPDQIACPYCHYVGRFKHWQAELNPASRLGDYFPWPDSRNLDSEDAELLQNMLALSQPSAREYYACTDVTPWQLDQRPQPQAGDIGRLRKVDRTHALIDFGDELRTWHIPLWAVGEVKDPFADDRRD
jgi:hypothetical protein